MSEPTAELPGARAEQTIFASHPAGWFRSTLTNEGPGVVRVRIHLKGGGLISFPLNPGSSAEVSMGGVWLAEIELVHDPNDGVHEYAQGTF